MNINQGTLTLISKTEVARETIRLIFSVTTLRSLTGETLKPEDWTFEAGQFISLGFDTKTWRAYSIASTPKDPEIELVVRLVEGGKGSEALRKMKVGETLDFKGPFGHFVLSENKENTLVFCGTGTGIAPLRSMILAENNKENPRDMILLYGGRNADDIAYLDEIEKWSEKLKIYLGLSRDSEAEKFAPYAKNCRITKFLEDKVYPENSEFYICGNGQMVVSVQEILHSQGIPKERIFMERFN